MAKKKEEVKVKQKKGFAVAGQPKNKGHKFSSTDQPEYNPGRPPLDILPDDVFKLALIHCTANEIASVLNCHVDTIYARFSDVLRRGHEEGQMSLKRKMHQKAMDGDTSMLIWISKQRLGYRDKPADEDQSVQINVYTNESPR